jgi:signal transduction histidine kinase/FixJ family two-component response regulator
MGRASVDRAKRAGCEALATAAANSIIGALAPYVESDEDSAWAAAALRNASLIDKLVHGLLQNTGVARVELIERNGGILLVSELRTVVPSTDREPPATIRTTVPLATPAGSSGLALRVESASLAHEESASPFRWQNFYAIGGAMLALYVALLASLRRSAATIRQQQLELVDACAALKAACEAADQANRAKSMFLAHVCHEVRSPLHGMLGVLRTLLGTPLEGAQTQMVRSLDRSSQALLRLTNDMLDLSKIESGRLTLESRPFDLREVVDDVVELMTPLATEKALTIVANIAAAVPPTLLGDADRLRQVLVNLVGNSIKFTSQGSVTIEVGPEHPGSADRYRIAVSDTGIGIAPENLEQIFLPFAQADAQTYRRYGGTGLGLTIVGKLVRLMGGDIKAYSKVGVGSSFVITVQLQTARKDESRSAGSMPDARFPRATAREARPLRILVVDDDEVNRTYTDALVRALGHRATLAANGRQALAMWRDTTFDLVMMDCHMPMMNGFAAASAIRKEEIHSRSRPTLIVAMTGCMDFSDEASVRDAAGMDAVLSKPFQAGDLKAVIEKLLTSSRPASGATAAPADDVHPTAELICQ